MLIHFELPNHRGKLVVADSTLKNVHNDEQQKHHFEALTGFDTGTVLNYVNKAKQDGADYKTTLVLTPTK